MKLSPQFKNEFKKALKLSVFLTVLIVGTLLFGASRLLDQRVTRSIASDPAKAEEKGMSEASSGRGVPPYERRR